MPPVIDIHIRCRSLIANLAGRASREELLEIPEPFRNNILWNVGHVVVTQQLLHYGQAGLELHTPDSMVSQFRKGTSPAEWDDIPDSEAVLELAGTLPGQLAEDYATGRFKSYDPYVTSAGVRLETIEDALSFNNFHEGIHTGLILSIYKLVKAVG